jgi:hypothetical protein
MHDDAARCFPEFAHLIKWHLVDADGGPMHYVANTVYVAGDRDCNGLRKGEFKPFTDKGLPLWELRTPTGAPTYTLNHKTVTAATQPDPVVLTWQPYGRTGEGKARDLDAARRVAIWPDATDEQLCAEPAVLRTLLEARLPALLAEFKACMSSLGFKHKGE